MRDKVEAVVQDVLDPLLQADGGQLELVDVREDTDTVVVRLGGAYAGCPSVRYTVDGVIRPALEAAVGYQVHVEIAYGPPPATKG